MNFDAINPVSFKNVKKRRMALFFFEINKEYRCLTSFEKLGEAICKQEEEEILYFFPLPLSFSSVIYSRNLDCLRV